MCSSIYDFYRSGTFRVFQDRNANCFFLTVYLYEKYIISVLVDNLCKILIKGILGCQVLLCKPGGTLTSIYTEIQKIVATNIYFINTISQEQKKINK